MKVTMVMVSSVNGVCSRKADEDVSQVWTSAEDKAMFRSLRESADVVIMGSKSFDVIGKKPYPGVKNIVLTRHPQRYAQPRSSELEITDQSPEIIFEELRKQRLQSILVTGGPTINSLLLEKKLITHIALTVEPILFGSGISISEGLNYPVELMLESSRQCNPQGTLFLLYKVI